MHILLNILPFQPYHLWLITINHISTIYRWFPDPREHTHTHSITLIDKNKPWHKRDALALHRRHRFCQPSPTFAPLRTTHRPIVSPLALISNLAIHRIRPITAFRSGGWLGHAYINHVYARRLPACCCVALRAQGESNRLHHPSGNSPIMQQVFSDKTSAGPP